MMDHLVYAKIYQCLTLSKSPKSSKMKHEEHFGALILTIGSFPMCNDSSRSLGYTIFKPVLSLFTFDAKDLVKMPFLMWKDKVHF